MNEYLYDLADFLVLGREEVNQPQLHKNSDIFLLSMNFPFSIIIIIFISTTAEAIRGG
jgi:hypothetical protein